MLTKEDLQLLSQLMDEKLEPIKKELSEIKEHAEISREVLNSVVDWIDVYFRKDYPFPADKKSIV